MHTAKINKIVEHLAYFAAHPNVHGTTLPVVCNTSVRSLDVEQLTWEQIAELVTDYGAANVHLVPRGFVPSEVLTALGDSAGCDINILYIGNGAHSCGTFVQLLNGASMLERDEFYTSSLAAVRAALKAVA